MQEWFGVGVMLAGYQWGEVGRLLHVIVVVVGLGAGLSVHGRQLPLTPVFHNGRRVAVTKHVVGCTETVTVDECCQPVREEIMKDIDLKYTKE